MANTREIPRWRHRPPVGLLHRYANLSARLRTVVDAAVDEFHTGGASHVVDEMCPEMDWRGKVKLLDIVVERVKGR